MAATGVNVSQAILANTQRYVKDRIARGAVDAAAAAATGNAPAGRLRVEQVYVYSPPAPTWRAALVDAPTQAGKTWKCLDLLAHKLEAMGGNSLVLFVTQANCVMSATQIIARARADATFSRHVPPDNVYRASELGEFQHPGDLVAGNYMVADFWNARGSSQMLDFVRATRARWSNITIVVDEADAGGLEGMRTRLDFVHRVERAAGAACVVRLILITATVSNLSKSVLQIANANAAKYHSGIVSEIVHKPVVEHHFAHPHAKYVGPSWFKDAKDAQGRQLWRKLRFAAPPPGTSKDQEARARADVVLRELGALPADSKELSLIVTSTRTEDQRAMAQVLFNVGFNVAVELNAVNSRNYVVHYLDGAGGVATWAVPYNTLEALANRGQLSSAFVDDVVVDTGLHSADDVTLAHVLQAALFMGTDARERIKRNTEPAEYRKLVAMAAAVAAMPRGVARPREYPAAPRVALVAGHLAGRGITIQNPFVDFVCTSFCFTDTKDVAQRGAINSQRFGRACGMLKEIYTTAGRAPALIATEGIMADAVANEVALVEKAATIEDGGLVSLKDLITKSEWDAVMKRTKKELKEVAKAGVQKLSKEQAEQRVLQLLYNSPDRMCNLANSAMANVDAQLAAYTKSQKGWLLNDMIRQGLIRLVKRSHYVLTDAGFAALRA